MKKSKWKYNLLFCFQLVIRPAKDGFRFLLNLVDDEHQSEEQVHVNDDSQDYTPGNH